jgi:hypothetical protein
VNADLRAPTLVGRFDEFAEAVHRCSGRRQVPSRHDGWAGGDVPVLSGNA